MSELLRVRLRVTGVVQGVGFRWFVKEAGRRLSLAGWVRNEPDGAVLLEAEGPRESVLELQRLVGDGPAHARVTSVEPLAPGSDELPQPFGVVR